MILETIAVLEAQIEALDLQIRCLMKEHEVLLARMKQAPGISDVSACDILAEIGPSLKERTCCVSIQARLGRYEGTAFR